jgi:CheY-like chemotaxis protein
MNQSNLSANERVRRISELLKTADRHVLAGEFDKAQEQVDLVFQLDPDNIYAKAYLKRIEVFKDKQVGGIEQYQEAKATPTEPEDELPPEQNSTGPQTPTEEKQKEQNIDDEHVQRQASTQKLSPEEERRIIEAIVSSEADLLESPKDDNNRIHPPDSAPVEKDPEILKQEENEREYRQALEALWKEGSVSESNRQNLENLRSALDISDERHNELERSVKLTAYVNAVKEAWQDGLITPTSAAALDELRERYNMSIDEHLMIESRIMYELHGMRVKGVVMVIDDDVELVKIIKLILREEGYAPFSAHSPEHGLQILERTTPDLILLDVTFPKPSVSGFTTYEQIRKRPNLRFVPVIFLSGLDEEHIVQVGKKLGADDYITKPCSEKMLVSTIEGKIKRYKEMRKIFEQKGDG